MALQPTEISIDPKQEKRLKRALQKKFKSLKLKLKLAPGSGKILLLTEKQIQKIQKDCPIIMREKQIHKNKSYKGGMLMGLLAAITTALATTLAENAILGNSVTSPVQADGLFIKKKNGRGLFLKRHGRLAKISQKGETIILRPTKQNIQTVGDGIFLLDSKNNIFSPINHPYLKILI